MKKNDAFKVIVKITSKKGLKFLNECPDGKKSIDEIEEFKLDKFDTFVRPIDYFDENGNWYMFLCTIDTKKKQIICAKQFEWQRQMSLLKFDRK